MKMRILLFLMLLSCTSQSIAMEFKENEERIEYPADTLLWIGLDEWIETVILVRPTYLTEAEIRYWRLHHHILEKQEDDV